MAKIRYGKKSLKDVFIAFVLEISMWKIILVAIAKQF